MYLIAYIDIDIDICVYIDIDIVCVLRVVYGSAF